jgi:integrative and conjugative element protein (TIGR02256 family)
VRCVGFEVQIVSSALEDMRAEATRRCLYETGGILIGHWPDTNTAVITNAIGPGSRARHKLFTFEPDSRFSQEQLNSIYWASDGKLSYIGDWHTHPLGSLIPSQSDSETTFQVAADPDYRAPKPILLLFRLRLFRSEWQARAFIYFLSERKYFEGIVKVIDLGKNGQI